MYSLGSWGENKAAEFLIKNGWAILSRNYRTHFGEIDLIARDQYGQLIFVEVKTLRKGSLVPEDNLTPAKFRKFCRIAGFYANAHPVLVGEKGWRMDLLAIVVDGANSTIKHYENITT